MLIKKLQTKKEHIYRIKTTKVYASLATGSEEIIQHIEIIG
jgi:hypothetical protein